MAARGIFFVLALLVCGSFQEDYVDENPDHECPDEEHYWNDSIYVECKNKAESEFLLDSRQETMCKLLDVVSDECLRVFEKCFQPATYQDVRDLSLRWEVEKLAKLFGIGETAKDCAIAKEYESRTGQDLNVHSETDECSTPEVTTVLAEYKTCGNKLRDKLSLQLRNPGERRGEVRDVICDHLDDLLTQCFDSLEPCFDSKYVWGLKRYQKELLGAFFYQMASDFGFHIRQCPVFNREETYSPDVVEEEQRKLKEQEEFWRRRGVGYNSGAIFQTSLAALAFSAVCFTQL